VLEDGFFICCFCDGRVFYLVLFEPDLAPPSKAACSTPVSSVGSTLQAGIFLDTLHVESAQRIYILRAAKITEQRYHSIVLTQFKNSPFRRVRGYMGLRRFCPLVCCDCDQCRMVSLLAHPVQSGSKKNSGK
jgi:hypothetical protein